MRQGSQITDRYSAEWLAGYRAALADLDAAFGTVLGPEGQGVSSLVHARLKAQLLRGEAGQPRPRLSAA